MRAALTDSLHVAPGRERTAIVRDRCLAVSDGMAVRRTLAVRDFAAETAGAMQAMAATARAMSALARARGGTRRANREASVT